MKNHANQQLHCVSFLSLILSTDQFQTKYYLPVTSGPTPVVPLPTEPGRIPTTSETVGGGGGDRSRPTPPGARPTDGGKEKLDMYIIMSLNLRLRCPLCFTLFAQPADLLQQFIWWNITPRMHEAWVRVQPECGFFFRKVLLGLALCCVVFSAWVTFT